MTIPRSYARPALLRVLSILVLASASCTAGESSETGPEPETRRTPVHVDSIFPIEEEIRRFREGLVAPDRLSGDAGSIEILVDRFLRALEAGDGDRALELSLDRAEFAWHYYPHTMYVERPYELSPSLVWYQLQNRSSRGLTRALRRYDGRTLHDTGVDCPTPPEPFGTGRIHHDCAVVGELPGGEGVREILFGSILERNGVFKFVGFTNEL